MNSVRTMLSHFKLDPELLEDIKGNFKKEQQKIKYGEENRTLLGEQSVCTAVNKSQLK